MNETTKVAVVGAGRVGSTVAYTLAASGLVRELVIIDANRERAEGEAMDIAQAIPFAAPVRVQASGLTDCAGAAVTVIAAGAAQREGETRPALLRRNLEHGDSELVAWSTASLANVPLHQYCELTGMSCSPAEMDAIAARVRDAAYAIIRRKGATNFAIAATLTRIIEAIVRDEASVLTVSTFIEGHYGIEGVCLSLPAIVSRAGVRCVLPIPLSTTEVERLRASADAVRAAMDAAALDIDQTPPVAGEHDQPGSHPS